MNTSIPKNTELEFINVQPLNPLISRCEIKVLYTGKNRNRSFISKEVANRIANTLPGVPIVGEFLDEAADFDEHGEENLIIDKNGVRFVKTTVPYGYVPMDAKVWWADFIDKDGISREYLVTEGYLWTGRYPECKRVIEQGNHQSMEFDRDSLVGEWTKVSGEWSKVENDEPEYFKISDAVFSALCILGQNVEPCFEGANITKNSSLVYSLNKNDFKEQMLDFMQDLKLALNDSSYEGGKEMPVDLNDNTIPAENEVGLEPEIVEEKVVDDEENTSVEDEFAAKKKEDEEEDTTDDNSDDEDNDPNDEDDDEEDKKKKKQFAKEEDDEEKKKKCGYSLDEVVEYQELLVKFNAVETELAALKSEMETIKPEYSKLKELEAKVADTAKDELIKSFYMLSDDQKKEVVENKAKYSLEEIESKLSVICVRNKVNFNLEDDSETDTNTETPITTFAVDNTFDSTPDWIKVVDRVAKNRR